MREQFQNPGGRSALRRATKSNPRKCSCPTCGRKNMLTAKDVKLGYQCVMFALMDAVMKIRVAVDKENEDANKKTVGRQRD